jgi:hypothetical protein
VPLPRRALALLCVTSLVVACGSDTATRADTLPPAPDAPVTAAPLPDPTIETTTPVPETEPPADLAEWTVLLYSMADTDLEPFMVSDVNELGEVGGSGNVNMVALVDRAADHGEEPLLDQGDWVGAKLMLVGQNSATVLDEYDDLNTGDPQVFADFLVRGITDYPAQRYAVVLSDHGAAWPGIGGDESAESDLLDLAELQNSLATALEATGTESLDLLGFDACLMATYEVVTSLYPFAERMIASEELEPGHGWDYRSFGVLANGGVDVDTLGREILAGYRAQAETEETDETITLSLLDLTQVEPLIAAVDEFSTAINERADFIGPLLGSKRVSTLEFGRSPDEADSTHMIDLGHLVSQIGVESLDLSDPADAVLRAIGDVVMQTVEGAATLDSTGLSIYFPPTESLFNPDYDATFETSPWRQLLATYFGAAADIDAAAFPSFIAEEGPSRSGRGTPTDSVTVTDDGLTLTGQLASGTEANVVEAIIGYGLVDDEGNVVFFGSDQATVDGAIVSGTYDFTVLNISDGTNTAIAYVDSTYDEDGTIVTFDVPMTYTEPGSSDAVSITLSIAVDTETGDVVSETFYVYDDELGTFGEFTADPAGTLMPELLVYGGDGSEEWVTDDTNVIGADLPSLMYDFTRLEPGTAVFVDLTAIDFAGNADTITAEALIP